MKHNLKITIILLSMFIFTQFIGLYVVDHYSNVKIINGKIQNVTAPKLPLGLEIPQVQSESDYTSLFYDLILAFIIAVSLLFVLTRFKAAFILKAWFFVVVVIALTVFFNAVVPEFKYMIFFAVLISIILAYIKIYKRNLLIHNLTELAIYPGIAAVFVPILSLFWLMVLLILISLYDMWAVWHSKVMQKMAMYQINELNIFSGFFFPYLSKQMKEKLKKLRKSSKLKVKLKGKKIRANVAILGGGDIIFSIISAGVMLKTLGLVPALLVVLGATAGLSYLMFYAEKKKFYPAMPFISAGIFIAILLSYLIF